MTPVHARQSANHRSRLAARAAVALVIGLVAALVPTTSGAQRSIADELARAQEEATAIAEELAMIETDLANLESEIARIDDEIDEVRSELVLLEDDVREIAVQRYVSAANGPLTIVEDPHDHQRIDVLMSAVQRDSTETMAAYEDARQRLESSNRSLADRIDDQESARERLAARLVDLNDELERLAELQRQAEAERARIEAERRQAALLAAQTTTTTTTRPSTTTAAPNPGGASPASTAPPTTAAPTTTTAAPTTTTTAPATTTTTAPSSGSGGGGSAPSDGFVCPVRGASAFTDTWRAPRSGGRAHMGVDMLAKTGTPAVAPVGGTVTHRYNELGGHSYHLNGDDGNFYYGTHLSSYGESGRVSAGTVIGYVGDSGNAAGIPHLHFEIHIGGRGNPINPYPTVKAACG